MCEKLDCSIHKIDSDTQGKKNRTDKNPFDSVVNVGLELTD